MSLRTLLRGTLLLALLGVTPPLVAQPRLADDSVRATLFRIFTRDSIAATMQRLLTRTDTVRQVRIDSVIITRTRIDTVRVPALLPSTSASVELPRVLVDVTWPALSGRVLTVAAGGSVQRALDSARAGDVVSLAAGATWVGNFLLPNRGDAGWVLVTSNGALPARGQQVTRADTMQLARLRSPNANPALATRPGAAGWRLVGLDLGVQAGVPLNYGIVGFGDGSTAQRTVASIPQRLILDRSYVHGTATQEIRRCVGLNSGEAAIIDSYLTECHQHGADSQAVWGWNGPGPYRIEHNTLEAGHEVIGFGGAVPAIVGLVPSDIAIRFNHITRPMAWKGAWQVKNLLELKAGRRVLIEGNAFDHNWVDAQNGFAILLRVTSENGAAAWNELRDVTVRYNTIDSVAGGINIADGTAPVSNVTNALNIEQNIFTHVGLAGFGTNGRLFQILGAVQRIRLAHNTGFAPVHDIIFAGNAVVPIPIPGLVLTDNLLGGAAYTLFSSLGQGAVTLAAYGGGTAQVAGNVLVTPNAKAVPAGNVAVPSLAALGAPSTYLATSTDQTPPGANTAVVRAAVAFVP